MPPDTKHATKSFSDKFWEAVGTVVAVGLGILVILFVIGAFLGVGGGALQTVNQGLQFVNQQLRIFGFQSHDTITSIFQIVIPVVLIYFVLKFLKPKDEAHH